MIKNNLILFLKYPEPGKVKTRIGKVIGYEKAADIYTIFIKHLIFHFSNSNIYSISVHYSPKEKGKEISEQFMINDIEPQTGNNLGERLSNAFELSFAKGYTNTIIIGSDCLDITNDNIEEAFRYLSGNYQSVIGPTHDGGYYLIGFSEKNYPSLFEKIDWSTEKVFAQTMKKLNGEGIKSKTLNYYSDIDEISDINSNVIKIINSYKPELRININT